MITGFVKTDLFYEKFDFQNRGFAKNLPKFWTFFKGGSNNLKNVFAALSCVSSK